jgi:hypothetical protein
MSTPINTAELIWSCPSGVGWRSSGDDSNVLANECLFTFVLNTTDLSNLVDAIANAVGSVRPDKFFTGSNGGGNASVINKVAGGCNPFARTDGGFYNGNLVIMKDPQQAGQHSFVVANNVSTMTLSMEYIQAYLHDAFGSPSAVPANGIGAPSSLSLAGDILHNEAQISDEYEALNNTYAIRIKDALTAAHTAAQTGVQDSTNILYTILATLMTTTPGQNRLRDLAAGRSGVNEAEVIMKEMNPLQAGDTIVIPIKIQGAPANAANELDTGRERECWIYVTLAAH